MVLRAQFEKSSRVEELSAALATASAQLTAAESDRARLEASLAETRAEASRLLEEARASAEKNERQRARVEAADAVSHSVEAQLAASEARVKALLVGHVNKYV